MSPHDDPLRQVRRAVRAGQFREAWDELQRSPAGERSTPEWQLLAAMAAWRLGDFTRSRSAAVQARDGYRSVGDTDGEMRAENVAAAGAFAVGSLPDAERGFSRAMALADELADDLMTARCANNLGNVAYYLAQYVTALSFYRLAAATFGKIESWKGLAEAWLNTTIVLREFGDLEGARDAGERAVASAEVSEDQRILGQALAARSDAFVELGDLELARAQAERALALATSNDDLLGEAEASRILSIIARRSGEFDRAEETGQRSLAVAERVQHPWTMAEAQRELGELYFKIGRAEQARAAFAAAAREFDNLGATSRADEMRQRADAAAE
jgi:tetratricopeptide (TPR) repeat protein